MSRHTFGLVDIRHARSRLFLLIGLAVAGIGGIVVAGSPRAAADTAPVLRLLSTIRLEGVRGRLDHLSLDAPRQRLFLAALGNNSVEVVDLAANKRTRTIPGLAHPQGVLYLADANRLAVANAQDGSVRLFDATSLASVQSLAYGDDADNLRIDPTGHVWVGYGHALGEFTADGMRGADIVLPEHPESFQIEAHGPRIFVNLPDAGTVAVVDRQRRTIVATWRTGAHGNFAMALHEDSHRLFVASRRPARLTVFDTDTGSIVQTLPTVGDCDDLFVDAKRGRVYVVGGEGAIAVTDEQFHEIARIRTVPKARTAFFSPALDRLYVAVPAQGAESAALRVYGE